MATEYFDMEGTKLDARPEEGEFVEKRSEISKTEWFHILFNYRGSGPYKIINYIKNGLLCTDLILLPVETKLDEVPFQGAPTNDL